MRVYTEVIFEWNESQGKLVEVSSVSEDYTGAVALAMPWSEVKDENGQPMRYLADTNGDGTYDGYIQAVQFSSGGHIHEFKMQTIVNNSVAKEHWYSWFGEDGAHHNELFGSAYSEITEGGVNRAALRKLMGEAADENNTAGFPNKEANWISNKPPVSEGDDGDGSTIISEGDETSFEDAGKLAEVGIDSLKQLTQDWGRIATGDSEYHRTVQAAIDDLDRAGQGVEGETYIDPATGQPTDILGTLEKEQLAYETSVAQAKEDFESGRAATVTGVSRTLEDMVVGIGRAGDARDTGLAAAREGFTPAIRQAEAASAATGFAGTGVGEVAREALSEQLMGNVEAVETGFTETREDLRVEERALGTTAGREMQDMATTQERAIESAGTALGGAEANFAGLKVNLDQVKTTQHKAAQNALRTIQTDMAAIISDTRTSLDNPAWDPFKISGSPVEGQENIDLYGWSDPGFDPTKAEEQVTIEGV